MLKLVEPSDGKPINGISVPGELYWVIDSPTPLAGMKFPRSDFPWSSLQAAGFSKVVSLHPGSFNPAPLVVCSCEALEDLVHGGPPAQPNAERAKVTVTANPRSLVDLEETFSWLDDQRSTGNIGASIVLEEASSSIHRGFFRISSDRKALEENTTIRYCRPVTDRASLWKLSGCSWWSL